jgi:hypothetical protein
MRILIAIAGLAAGLTMASAASAPKAYAQANGCRTVEISAVRHRTVELFDMRGRLVRRERRDSLGPITEATECPTVPEFLRVETNGEPFLVRRFALQVRTGELVLPPCTAEHFQSQAVRNASSSGLGGAPCQPQ